MLKQFFAIITIVGMVVGSGVVSGKEIVVFFSRFGYFSFFTIIISFFMFYFLFKFILVKCEYIKNKIKNSKFALLANFIFCTIFSASMFAGINNLLNSDENLINILIFLLIFLFCVVIFKKGIKSLNKLNLILVPVMLFVFAVLLISKITSVEKGGFNFGGVSIFYAILYVLLNVSSGCVLIADLGRELTKKQKTRVAFFSALVLSLILLITNMVLLAYPNFLSNPMPLLDILGGNSVVIEVLIFIGSATTLFSIVYSISIILRSVCKNEIINFFVCIGVPLFLSLWGFGPIIAYLYPLASVMGGMFLFWVLFIPSFNRNNQKIHSGSQNTKDKNACHNNIEF